MKSSLLSIDVQLHLLFPIRPGHIPFGRANDDRLPDDDGPHSFVRSAVIVMPRFSVLHLPAGRELLDIDSFSANPRAYRATPVASDVIERTAQTGSRIDAGRGVSEVDRPGGQILEHAGPAEQNPEKAPGVYSAPAEGPAGAHAARLVSQAGGEIGSISEIPGR